MEGISGADRKRARALLWQRNLVTLRVAGSDLSGVSCKYGESLFTANNGVGVEDQSS